MSKQSFGHPLVRLSNVCMVCLLCCFPLIAFGQAQEPFAVDTSIYLKPDKSINFQKIEDDVDSLYDQKEYTQLKSIVEAFSPFALDNQSHLIKADILIIYGDSYYKQKRYSEAVVHFLNAITYLNNSTSDNEIKRLGDAYTRVAQTYKRMKNKETPPVFYKKALDTYSSIHAKKYIARTLSALAEAERNLDNYIQALQYGLSSIQMYEQVSDSEGKAKALSGVGIIYRLISRYEKSIEYLRESNDLYKALDDKNGVAKTSTQIGLLYTKLGQFEEAKSFYTFVVETPEEDVEPNAYASALRELSVIYTKEDEYDKALYFGRRSQLIYQKENNHAKAAHVLRVIGSIYRDQGDKGKAIEYYKNSYALAKKIGDKKNELKALILFSQMLVESEANEAISLLQEGLQLAAEIGEKNQALYALRLLKDAEKSIGNIDQAFIYAEKEIKLSNTIRREQDERQLTLAKTSLLSHSMEIELDSLREKVISDQLKIKDKNNEIALAQQTRQIAELELSKNKFANLASTSLLVVCLMVVLLVYRRFILSKRHNKKLRYLSQRDPLTDCYNRRALMQKLEAHLSDDEGDRPLCVVLVDIDFFKAVNDTHGHTAGDAVIVGVAKALMQYVEEDVIVSRYGGEEFCVLFPNVTQRQAFDIAEHLRNVVENTDFEGISVTISLGVSSLESCAKDSAQLIEHADSALYASKANGRNKTTLWNDEL